MKHYNLSANMAKRNKTLLFNLVLLRYFQKHIFLRGVVATPLNFYNEPPYTPVCGTNG